MKRIVVEVKTSAREENVEKLNNGRYEVSVRASKRKGKANVAVLKLLKKYFGAPVKIISGLKSNLKIVEIEE